jgi:hypothetical protein
LEEGWITAWKLADAKPAVEIILAIYQSVRMEQAVKLPL